MTDKQNQAVELFMQGYNCAQAVAGAFAAETGYTSEELMRMAAAFGGGFARTRNLCGAVSAMGLVLSLCMATPAPDAKGDVYAAVRKLTDQFEQQYGTLVCAELLKEVKGITSRPQPDPRTEQYYKKRPCAAYVMAAAGLIENYLQ